MGNVREASMTGNLPRGSVFAILLILAGAVLFLDNIGVLPIPDIQAYWPIFIIFWGAIMLERWRSAFSVIWGLAIVAWGILLILGNLHILPITGAVFWAIALIAGGVTLLVSPVDFRAWQERMRAAHDEARERNEKRRMDFREWNEQRRAEFRERNEQRRTEFRDRNEKRRMEIHDWQDYLRARVGTHPAFTIGAKIFSKNRLRESSVFGSLNRRVQTQQFEGGKVDAVFGSISLDLTEATIAPPDHTAILKVDAVFGGVEITVPRTWRVVMNTAAVLGGCDDRTIPPRPEPGVETPTLVIKGSAVFGGIEIHN
jgi:predicted membrane protein